MKAKSTAIAFLLVVYSGYIGAHDVPHLPAKNVCDSALRATTGKSKVEYFDVARRSDAFGMSSPFSIDGYLNEEVAPDVLYVWMGEENLNRILNQANPDSLLPELNRPHYLWRTPMGSFGYGAVSVRLKLKRGVKFALIPHMHTIYEDYEERLQQLKKDYDLKNTVFVAEIPRAGYHEYFVFNGGPIHSLSVGTKEHLAEMNMLLRRPQGTVIFDRSVEPIRENHFYSKLKMYWELQEVLLG